MKKFSFSLAIFMFISMAQAEVECTKEPASKWKNQDTFQKELSASYKIKKFKVTKGNCYEIYGFDKSGKRVEIYFHPVTGEIIKQKD